VLSAKLKLFINWQTHNMYKPAFTKRNKSFQSTHLFCHAPSEVNPYAFGPLFCKMLQFDLFIIYWEAKCNLPDSATIKEERKSWAFGMTWGGVNDDKTFLLGW